MTQEPVALCPARLEPIFSPRPWGARSLAPFFPHLSGLAEPIGEAWMTGTESRFASGPFAGRTLGEVWARMPTEWAGTSVRRDAAFPLLVKFIFTEEKLSVQVHPDDEYAARHEPAAGGSGKTEMWYAVRARSGAEVMVGTKSQITRKAFERAIATGTAEECLERVPLHQGEAIFVPAGTAHTIGPGLVLCEIQQNSDLTYRVYDYNRRDAQGRTRALHVDKALAVMRFGDPRSAKIQPVSVRRGPLKKTFLTACRYFATEKWEFTERIRARASPDHFELYIVLEGRGQLQWAEQSTAYREAQVWMIPAALAALEMTPASSTSILRTYVPSRLDEWARELSAAGLPATEISRLVHR